MTPAGHAGELERALASKVREFQALVRHGGSRAIHEIASLKAEIDALKDQILATGGEAPATGAGDDIAALEQAIQHKSSEFTCLVQQHGIAARDRIASLKAEIDALEERLAAAKKGSTSMEGNDQ